MTKAPNRPWIALTIAVDLGFWTIAVVHEWIVRGPFIDLGGDWARFWGATRAFDGAGPVAGYDLPHIAAFMQPLAQYARPGIGGVRPGPAPYPPLFLELFTPFTAPPPVAGFALWTALNIGLALLVARRLARHVQPHRPWPATLALVGFFPLMLTLFAGQVTILLLACLMETVTEFERGRELRAGIWTGMVVLKPQYAVIILLVYLAKRRVAATAGFAIGSGVILAGSLAAGGIDGVAAYVRMLVTAYPAYAGSTGIDPRGMIGWRGLVATAFPSLSSGTSLLVVATLSVMTVAVLPFVWRGAWMPSGPRFARQLTATVAVTLLVAYHSQPHGATLLLVPGTLVVAYAGEARVVRWLLVGTAVGGPVIGLVSALALGNLWLVGPATCVAMLAVVAGLVVAERASPGNDADISATAALKEPPLISTRLPAIHRPRLEAG